MSKRATHDLRPIEAVSFIRHLRGGSQSALIQGNDGQLYRAKFYKNPQGPNLLANEWIGTALASSVGLPVAPSVMIRISDQFLEQYPELHFQYADRVERLDPGIHFGSLYLGQDDGKQRIFQYLPRSQRRHLFNADNAIGIALLDILAVHADDRQAIFTKHPSRAKIIATYVDFGHFFGGPHWGSVSQRWPTYHYTSSLCPELWTDKTVSRWIAKLQAKVPHAFSTARKEVPSCWHAGDLNRLEDGLLTSLESFPESIMSFLFQQGPQYLGKESGLQLPTSVAI